MGLGWEIVTELNRWMREKRGETKQWFQRRRSSNTICKNDGLSSQPCVCVCPCWFTVNHCSSSLYNFHLMNSKCQKQWTALEERWKEERRKVWTYEEEGKRWGFKGRLKREWERKQNMSALRGTWSMAAWSEYIIAELALVRRPNANVDIMSEVM